MRLRLSKQHIRPVLRHFTDPRLLKVLAEHPALRDELSGMARASLDWGLRAVTEKYQNGKTLDAFLARASSSPQIAVALHGYFAVGDHFTSVYKRTLEREYGIPFCAPEYPTFRDISLGARYCGTIVKKVLSETDADVALVGHSLGCLVGLEMYYTRLSEAEQKRISHLLLLCGPHQGTPIARHGYGTSARQMEEGSDYIRAWQDRYPTLSHGEKIWSLSAPADAIVPVSAVHLPIPGAKNHALEDFGIHPRTTHVSLLYNSDVAHLLGQIIVARNH